uniref:Cytochrome P450 n=1 Tax=Coptotermes formosanus TaxID=36987 RepID=L7NZA4_COPFO|nr:cytochrome P450 [Coptotermes formosanus]
MDWNWALSDWIVLLAALVTAAYLCGTWSHNHFKKRNVPYIRPAPFFGNKRPAIRSRNKEHFPDYILRTYRELQGHAYGGTFNFMQPEIILRDPELIKTITVKDFEHFTNHGSFLNNATEPIWDKSLFSLSGQRWKDMRSTLSPAFTSSKMKAMFGLVSQCCQQLVDHLEQCYEQPIEQGCDMQKDGEMLILELNDLYTRYTNDVIATAAFGMELDSLKHPTNEFYMMAQRAVKIGSLSAAKSSGYLISPKLTQLSGVTTMSKTVTEFFRSVIDDTISRREKGRTVKPDIIQHLIQAKKGDTRDANSTENAKDIDNTHKLNDDDIAAQILAFLVAGLDTTSTLLSFASHQLAVYPEIQSRLQEEIDETLQEHAGKFTYEAVNSMKYLGMVVSETLRMFPPTVTAERLCIKPYTLDINPPLELEPGDRLFIPVYGLHHDPMYYPDPERFDPERFCDENKLHINTSAYLPFGSGPQSCIGNQFALVASKLVLVHLLSRFNIRVTAKTPLPMKIIQTGFNMSVEGGFWFGLELRSS